MVRQFDEDGQIPIAQEARIDHALRYRAPSIFLDGGFSLAHVLPAVVGPTRSDAMRSAWAVAFSSPRLDAQSSGTMTTRDDQWATNLPRQT